MQSEPKWQLFLLSTSILVIMLAPHAAGRDYKAVVYLKRPEAIGASLPFVEVYKPRINQEKKIVMGSAPRHNRSQYDKQARVEFDRVHSLGWSDRRGMMQLAMMDGTQRDCYCYPANAKPPRDDAWIDSSVMEAAQLTGEFVTQGRKIKTQVALGEIKKIYFVDASATLDGIAFQWATEENSIDAWKEFLRVFPKSVQASAANENLLRLLLSASEEKWQRFQSGGTLADLRNARAFAEQVLKIRSAEARALELTKSTTEAEQAVQAKVEQMASLVEQRQWDRALEAHRDIARFAPEVSQIGDLEGRALRGSHDFHRQAAREHMKTGQLEQAIAEYQVALGRLEDAEARAEFREANIQFALRRAERARASQDFQNAHGILQQAINLQGSDPRVEKLWMAVKTQWADRLVKQAAPLYVVSLIEGPAAEEKHRKALEQLEQANALMPRPETEKAVREVRRRLAGYYFQFGKKKLSPPGSARPAVAQAYLYLQRAESYHNELPGLPEALERAREAFRNKSSVGVNVAFTDKSARKLCSHIAAELEGFVGQEVTQAGLPGVLVVEREDFEKIKKEKAITDTFADSELTLNVQGAGVQVLGDIQVCEAKTRQMVNNVPSQYISGYRENPEYYRLMQLKQQYESQALAIDQQDDAYKACADQERRANIYGNCRSIRDQYKRQYDQVQSQLYQVNSALQNTQAQFPIHTLYRYTKRDLTVEGRVKGSFRIVDTLSSVRREQQLFSAEDTRTGMEISGAMPQDTNGVVDRVPNLPTEDQLLEQLVENVRRKIAEASVAFLRNFAQTYLERARVARDRGAVDDAVEHYILFLATTAQKPSRECEEAEQFLSAKRNLVYRPEQQ